MERWKANFNECSDCKYWQDILGYNAEVIGGQCDMGEDTHATNDPCRMFTMMRWEDDNDD